MGKEDFLVFISLREKTGEIEVGCIKMEILIMNTNFGAGTVYWN
jgi:hypothetical protein